MKNPDPIIEDKLGWAPRGARRPPPKHPGTTKLVWTKDLLALEWCPTIDSFLIYPEFVEDGNYNLYFNKDAKLPPCHISRERDLTQRGYLLYIRAIKEARKIQERWDEIFG